jgi:Domain of unknown function (DUF4394)
MPAIRNPILFGSLLLTVALALASCSTTLEPPPSSRKEQVYALNTSGDLVHFSAARPQQILHRIPVRGLVAGDTLIGIDFRVARGVLYALSERGQLYTLNPQSGQLSPVGSGTPMDLKFSGQRIGFDFNPAADRIRVVGDNGLNMRIHPDTGAVVDGDPMRDGIQADGALQYVPGDMHVGRTPRVVAAGYTYNKNNEKLTTNYAIDALHGALVMQGSLEGIAPAVSPNSGRLSTIGTLGTGPVQDAAFDIADINNSALAALRVGGRTRLYSVDLHTGKATLLGTIGAGEPLVGLAI